MPEAKGMTPARIPEVEAVTGWNTAQGFDHQDKSRLFLRLPLLVTLARNGMAAGEILEAGCGTGVLGLRLAAHAAIGKMRLTGIDISGDMIVTARNNSVQAGGAGNTRFIQADLAAIPFPDHTFDGIFSNGSLHHWRNPGRVLRELGRVLKPGGRILVNDLRRDVAPVYVLMLKTVLNSWQRQQFDLSQRAAYTVAECQAILHGARLDGWRIRRTLMEYEISGTLRSV